MQNWGHASAFLNRLYSERLPKLPNQYDWGISEFSTAIQIGCIRLRKDYILLWFQETFLWYLGSVAWNWQRLNTGSCIQIKCTPFSLNVWIITQRCKTGLSKACSFTWYVFCHPSADVLQIYWISTIIIPNNIAGMQQTTTII